MERTYFEQCLASPTDYIETSGLEYLNNTKS